MKTDDTRYERLIAAARLFYDHDLSKTAIGERMGISSMQVKRLLDAARKSGIVRIEYRVPGAEPLARELESYYPCLRRAIVIGSQSDYLSQTRALARTAAEYFDEELDRSRSNVKVGLSGGLTVFEFVKALPDKPRNITLYPTAILGRGDNIVNHFDPIASLMTLWVKSGYREGGLYLVTVTPMEKNKGRALTPAEVRRQNGELLKRKRVQRLFRAMGGVDMIFASLRQLVTPEGMKRPMGAMALDLLRDIGIDERSLEGAVGDLNYSFIDQSGKTRSHWQLFLSLRAGQLRSMARNPSKKVVVIAGQQKTQVLRAALKGQLLNVLITDEFTARALLS